MPRYLIAVGEHLVGGVTYQRVAKHVFHLTGNGGDAAHGDGLALDELIEDAVAGVAHERFHAGPPKGPSEHARSAEHVLCGGSQGVKPRLHHSEDGLRELATVLDERSDELLEVERISVRPLHDTADVFSS